MCHFLFYIYHCLDLFFLNILYFIIIYKYSFRSSFILFLFLCHFYLFYYFVLRHPIVLIYYFVHFMN